MIHSNVYGKHSKQWIIYDPIHSLILLDDSPCDRLLLDLINSREMQRLRRISQLGLNEYIFPGATHTRFVHSLGVMVVARKMLNNVLDPQFEEEERTVALAVALLHDIGHGPLSHVFERISGQSHERRTRQIVLDPNTDVHRVLRAYNKYFPQKVAAFFAASKPVEAIKAVGLPRHLASIVSSELDADRLDFLVRDSHFTGVKYGGVDVDWLVEHLHHDRESGRLYLDHKGLQAAEMYVLARHHMYRTVYLHKAARSAEVMLELLFKRYRTLLADGKARGLAPVLEDYFENSETLNDYLDLDDNTVRTFIKVCARADDERLTELGRGLLDRKLYKCTDLTFLHSTHPEKEKGFLDEVKKLVDAKGLERDYSLLYDETVDTPYKPYNPLSGKPDSRILIEVDGQLHEISEVSSTIKALMGPSVLVRLYYPDCLRDDVKELERKFIK